MSPVVIARICLPDLAYQAGRPHDADASRGFRGGDEEVFLRVVLQVLLAYGDRPAPSAWWTAAADESRERTVAPEAIVAPTTPPADPGSTSSRHPQRARLHNLGKGMAAMRDRSDLCASMVEGVQRRVGLRLSFVRQQRGCPTTSIKRERDAPAQRISIYPSRPAESGCCATSRHRLLPALEGDPLAHLQSPERPSRRRPPAAERVPRRQDHRPSTARGYSPLGPQRDMRVPRERTAPP